MKSTNKKSSNTRRTVNKSKNSSTKNEASTDQSKDNKAPGNEQKEFPGYPQYDPSEDITRTGNRVDANLDDDTLTRERRLREDDTQTLPPTENEASETTGAGVFDVNEEDLEALGPKDLSLDGNEDEQLKHRTQPVDFAGDDLDVPGTELDDDQEARGSEDEENNVYSLGGDKS